MSEQPDRNAAWADADEAQDAKPWRPLTAAEAQALRAVQPALAPWRVVVAQALSGGVVALLAWAVTGRAEALWSALYGAAVVVLPAAVMARGLGRPVPHGAAALGALRLLAWEAVKLVLAVVLLAAAPRLMAGLSWPALLTGMLVCLKVYWLALLWRGR